MSLTRPSAWCPRCGAEYREGFTECWDCQVALVDHVPVPEDHEPATIVVGGVGIDERSTIGARLTMAGIVHTWTADGQLIVAPSDEAAASNLVTEALHPDPIEVPVGDVEPAVIAEDEAIFGGDDSTLPLASRGQRLLGYVVDSLLWAGIFAAVNALWAPGHRNPVARLAVFVLPFGIYQVVGVAVWGRTVGKLVAGTEVVTLDGARPNWLASFVRWLVPAAAGAVATAARFASPFFGSVLIPLVYAPVAFSAQRRGLHDLAATTWVVNNRA